jgi:hypothetical protein
MMAFEVTSSWVSFVPLFRILESVDGVTDVGRQYRNDDRVAFRFQGERFVVNEPWGDNSRYWIGPSDPAACQVDALPLEKAFSEYKGWTIFSPKRPIAG